MRSRRRWRLGALCVLWILAADSARGQTAPSPERGEATKESGEVERLSALAPGLSRTVLARALRSLECGRPGKVRAARIFAVIDYALPSTARRLWIFDRKAPSLLLHDLVAHGRGSGDNYATSFSNTHGSLQSSLGLFYAAEPYVGINGESLRLDGLDPGFNDAARDRAIVLHGAPYATEEFAARHGRLGRSWGCPAVPPEHATRVIEVLRNGGLLFVSGDDERWKTAEDGRICRGESDSR